MYGRTIIKGTTINNCCARHEYLDCYVMFKFFPAVICKNCGMVTAIFSSFKNFLFEYIFSLFWDGKIKIIDPTVEDIKRLEELKDV